MASKETSRETDPAAGARPVGAAEPEKSAAKGGRSGPPDWSHGLRQLYDSVVEEDLPDSFRDLLDKLDQTDPAGTGGTKDSHPPRKGGGA